MEKIQVETLTRENSPQILTLLPMLTNLWDKLVSFGYQGRKNSSRYDKLRSCDSQMAGLGVQRLKAQTRASEPYLSQTTSPSERQFSDIRKGHVFVPSKVVSKLKMKM